MATAGRTLRVALVANTKNFRAGMMSAVRDAKGFQGKMSAVAMSMRGTLGPALAGAAAAAGALAVKLGVDGVKAAMEEQKALAQLTTALNNVGQGFAQTQVNQFIDDLMFATGVADDELRPAFVRLVSATKDAAAAQDLLSLALDISVGTGRSLEGVTLALSKAATGQTTALRRLGVPLSDAAVKSGDLQAITDELAQTFGGQAAAAADTMAGRMQILQVAASELQEAFGSGVVNALSDTSSGATDLAGKLRDLQGDAESLGQSVGDSIGTLLDLANGITSAKEAVDGLIDSMGIAGDIVSGSFGSMVNPVSYATGLFKQAAAALTGNDQAFFEAAGLAGEAADTAAPSIANFGTQAGYAAEETEDLVEQIGYLEDYVSRTSAVLDYEESWDNLRKTLKENGAQFDYNSKKGQENNRKLIEYAESTAAVAAEQETLFGKTAYVQDALGNLSKTFDKTKMSPETRAAMLAPFQALIDDLADANYDVSDLQTQIDKLKGKDITVRVNTVTYGRPPGVSSEEWYGSAVGGFAGRIRSGSAKGMDTVPTMLTPGEFVIRRQAVNQFGAALFSQLNRGINPLEGMSSRGSGRTGGFTIGNINVVSAPGERAEDSIPRSLRRMAFVAGMV